MRVRRSSDIGKNGDNATLGNGQIEHTYDPWGAAKTLFSCEQAEVLLAGPAGTGKSRAALERLHFLALMYPGMRGLMVRKVQTDLTKSALVAWNESVIREFRESGFISYYGGSVEKPAQYTYANGSTVMVAGMEKSSRIMSSEFDIIYVQEATELSLDDYQALTTRLRNGKIHFQQIISDCNPSASTHWLYRRFTDSSERRIMLESKHEDNPRLFSKDGTMTEVGEAYIAGLDDLTGVRYERLRLGLWSSAEGVIYEEWKPSVHLIPRFEIPSDWQRFWAVDFGSTNPFVLQRWAEDPDGRLYLYAEQYMTGKLVEDHARDVLALVRDDQGEWIEPKPRSIVCDHDAEGRATLERHLGISTTTAYKKVQDGIEAVQARLRVAKDGKPRLFILQDSLVEHDQSLVDAHKPIRTDQEIPAYVWKPPGRDEQPKEEPLKIDDHGCDAMRYLVCERDRVGKPNIRWM